MANLLSALHTGTTHSIMSFVVRYGEYARAAPFLTDQSSGLQTTWSWPLQSLLKLRCTCFANFMGEPNGRVFCAAMYTLHLSASLGPWEKHTASHGFVKGLSTEFRLGLMGADRMTLHSSVRIEEHICHGASSFISRTFFQRFLMPFDVPAAHAQAQPQ